MKFGDVLRSLLEERDITQKRLATDLNIAPSTVSSYVQNNSEPDFETLKQIAQYFGTSIDYLLDYRTGTAATREEDEILRIFRDLTPEQRIIFTGQGKVVVQFNKKERKQ
jgi:transcriptional regulator with XRE-family HTH domain